ncbi:MAG: hypothetical protein EXS16_12800 [Gemmataceae bacterium]|nr:hypothetical protein [Gemmataceae bacterium]
MANNIKKIAAILGAKIVTEVPDTGGGAFGAYRLAEIVARLQSRLEPGQGKRPGRPTAVDWVHHRKLPMSDETFKKLEQLAVKASTADRKVSPMQLAAQLLEEAIGRCGEAR